MCGFAVVVDEARDVTPELMLRMRETLVHRGPDADGLWVSEGGYVGFGHRRLSIIDAPGGRQPMFSPDGSLVLAYNGELYNHESLRADLRRNGRAFTTRSDTEVLLAAYERYGVDCLARLDGMFAFVIWDERRRSLFFARDRAGEKPLYYAATGTGYAFASEIKALLQHPGIGAGVDLEALEHYLSFLTTPAPETLFRGISKLPAAHCGTWSEEEGLRSWRWWSLPSRDPGATADEHLAAEEVRSLFAASVEERMMSDVPIGVYLSGGLDSSANVAFMSRHSADPLQTFSVAFASEPGLDELAEARAVAAAFGTTHHELVLDDDDVVRCLPDLVHHQDEPLADPVCVPLFHLARFTKESGVTVVQIGEGSDESFFGYPVYSQVFGAARVLRAVGAGVPRSVLRTAVRAARPFTSERRTEFALESLSRGIPAPHAVAGFSERHKRRLLHARPGRVSAFDYLWSRFGAAVSEAELADVALAHEFELRLPELLLMRIDKMTMAASVEARAPFLDPQLVEFAARLPLASHWTDEGGKRILKRAFGGVVPDSVLRRRKQGFGAPLQRWSASLRSIAKQELLREPMFDYFDRAALVDLLSWPSSRFGFELWQLLNFALWHRHWIEGEDLRAATGFATSLETRLSIKARARWASS